MTADKTAAPEWIDVAFADGFGWSTYAAHEGDKTRFIRSDLCASGQQVRADRHQIARAIWDAMTWAAVQGAPDGTLPKYMEWGNSLGECEARRTADRILAALTPAPQPEGFSINPEYQAIFDEAKARAPQAAGEAVPVDLSHGWLIHKAGRGWYRPNAKGYTGCIAEAGRYSHEDALAYSHPNGWDGPRDNITIKHESEVAHQPQPSETVAEASRLIGEARLWLDTGFDLAGETLEYSPESISQILDRLDAALRALKGGEANG
ncbi:hypothetical protein [Paracoccus sp. DMF]|uniref:hypothetical protein n=1 Tax=Paracoccus sp. DMF TaxID=400837 RepID=UPI001101D42E|nr:hypothetical protein [Paracoccus sp. DMF]MCV2449403.1 hypothetical protein [Paracoccus sp. DMF]